MGEVGRMRAASRGSMNKVLGAVLIVLAVVSTSVIAWQQVRIHDATTCQNRVNAAVIKVVDQRAKYADQDRTNLVTLVRAIATSRSGEETLAALHTYIAATDKVDKDRQKHPYPKLSDRCDA